MTSTRSAIGRLFAVVICLLVLAPTAWAQSGPSFPTLTGRVVDEAELLSQAAEARLTQRLEALQNDTSDQLVVVTVRDLQGYEIADYGYQLGRAWRIGQAEVDNGALLIVAPNEKKVRIEVGYGLEPILTDALSGLIIQNQILPAFRDGDFERGIEQGVDAIDQQLRLDPEEARARAVEAGQTTREGAGDLSGAEALHAAVIGLILLFLFSRLFFGGRGRRSGRNGVMVWAAAEALNQMSRSRGSRGGGWGGGGFGGGFGGGGGGFGGGGASGGW